MGNCRSSPQGRVTPPHGAPRLAAPTAGAGAQGSWPRPGPPLQHPHKQRPCYDLAAESSPVEEGKVYGDCDCANQRKNCCGGLTLWQRRALVGLVLAAVGVLLILTAGGAPKGKPGQGGRGGGSTSGGGPEQLPVCGKTPCPLTWLSSGGGGYYCIDNGGCQAGAAGPFPACAAQCIIGNPPIKTKPGAGGAHGNSGPLQPKTLTAPGEYDLRVLKGDKLLGCAAPIGIFPGNAKYGCSGGYSTAQTCDSVSHPIKDTQYVQAVHDGCETAKGQGTYGYAYDDGVGLKQCSPLTRYEWILCPTGKESGITWQATQGFGEDSTKRFRVTNACREPVWIAQATGDAGGGLPNEAAIKQIDPGQSYTYSVPNRGLPSTRFLPKTGCDISGNTCDIQSMPPCPPQGCDLPVDTKFEASWGCLYAKGLPEDRDRCSLTGQGNPSTYQDWWDGSAVDGWTLPFSILVDDGGHGLRPGEEGSPDICGPVVCAGLDAARLCPTREFLTPETS